MTASHPQYFIVIDSISPHSNSQLLTAIHCDEPNTGFEPRLISAHFFCPLVWLAVTLYFVYCTIVSACSSISFSQEPQKAYQKQKTAGISANGLSAVYFPGCRSERFDYQIPPVSRFTPSDSSSVSACLLLQTRMLHCQ